jgi:AcrR family transcriptional regulator
MSPSPDCPTGIEPLAQLCKSSLHIIKPVSMMKTPIARQERSRRTRSALLAALDALLLDRDFDAIGVADIARRANVSPASIYRRFSKKHGLLPALYDLQTERVAEWNEQGWVKARLASLPIGPTPLRTLLTGHVELAVRQLKDLAHIAKPLALYGRMKPHLFGDEVEAHLQAAHRGIRAMLEAYPAEIKRRDLDQASRMIGYHMQTALNDFVLFRDRTVLPGADLSDREFAKEIADFAYGYLTTPD